MCWLSVGGAQLEQHSTAEFPTSEDELFIALTHTNTQTYSFHRQGSDSHTDTHMYTLNPVNIKCPRRNVQVHPSEKIQSHTDESMWRMHTGDCVDDVRFKGHAQLTRDKILVCRSRSSFAAERQNLHSTQNLVTKHTMADLSVLCVCTEGEVPCYWSYLRSSSLGSFLLMGASSLFENTCPDTRQTIVRGGRGLRPTQDMSCLHGNRGSCMFSGAGELLTSERYAN